jgi:hypothetical protein
MVCSVTFSVLLFLDNPWAFHLEQIDQPMRRVNTKQWELFARQTEYACVAYAWETGLRKAWNRPG